MAVSEAVTLATRLPEIEFPEFTAKLINDTMDAMVASMIRQMGAYAELLSSVTKTVEAFEADEVGDEEVDQWLALNFPNAAAAEDAPLEDLHILKTGFSYVADPENAPIRKLLDAEFTSLGLDKPAGGTAAAYANGDLTDADVLNIRKAARRKLARTRLSVLQELVRMGIVRIIIDEGKIYTKLTFDISATQFHQKVKNTYRKKRWGAGGKASFLSGLFGISLGGSYQRLTVKTVRESDFSRVDARINIIGGVDVVFRTDYSPLGVP